MQAPWPAAVKYIVARASWLVHKVVIIDEVQQPSLPLRLRTTFVTRGGVAAVYGQRCSRSAVVIGHLTLSSAPLSNYRAELFIV